MTGIKRLREHGDKYQERIEGLANDMRAEVYAIADQIERERACDSDTAENIRLIVGRVIDDMERHILGHEGMEDSPVARWARELRAELGGDVRDPAADVSMSAYDLLPKDDRDAIAWVRDHGGLDSVRELLDWVVGHCSTKQQLDFDFWLSGRVMHELGFEEDMADRDEVERRLLARLMPEGMEWLIEAWPRFEDGEPVRIGDEVSVTVHDEDGDFERSMTADSISFGEHGIIVCDPCHVVRLLSGERVRRPAPKALDADGVEIRVGDTVYYVDGREQRVNTVARLTDDGCVQFGRINEAGYVTYCEAACIPPNQLTHRAPVLAADGEPLLKDETVWSVESGTRYTVEKITDELIPVKCRSEMGSTVSLHPSQLTHERPVLDADGAEIRVGDTVWHVHDLDKFTVTNPNNGENLSVSCMGEDGKEYCCYPNGLTHRAPVLAADGRQLREGETVWHVKTGREYVVVEPSYGDTVVVRLAKYDDAEGEQYAPDQLTHERPDSWEQLEEDAGKNPFDYCKDVGHRLDTFENSEAYKARDLVRRCRALAERERGE